MSPELVNFSWQGREAEAISDQWIVRVADVDTAWNNLALSLGDSQGLSDVGIRQLGRSKFGVLNASFKAAASIEQWVAQNPNVMYVVPDTWQTVTATAVPNDPQFGDLWGLNNTGQSGGTIDADIDGPEAWDITTGSSGVVVGVIDSGTDINHVDLAANIWQNPGEVGGTPGVDDDNNGYIDDFNGWDFVDNDNDPSGTGDHGTHTAGTIGAVGNNSTGVVGVNWDVSLMALRGVGGETSAVIEAIAYANTMKKDYGINVVATNNSWSGGDVYTNATMQDAIADADDEGILFISSAGNGGGTIYNDNDGDYPLFPASYPYDNVISVAATDRFDNLWGGSNIGWRSVHLAAPGSAILSTFSGNSYGTLTGTSMSTPQVTGVAALIAAADPTATAAEIKAAIMDGVDEIAALTNKTITGGRLNARGALEVALGGRIAGTLYEDANQNGTRQQSEPGLYNQQVFIDEDNSGGHNGSEPITTTDIHGNYSFTLLIAGTYRVRQVVQGGGWVQTTPTGDGSHLITLTSGEWVVDQNFGSHLPGAVLGLPFNEDFSDGIADNITEIHGPFSVTGGKYATGLGWRNMEPIALLKISDTLPSKFSYDVTLTIKDQDPDGGFIFDHEAIIIFDYQSTTDYKFVWVSSDGIGHLLIGQHDGGIKVVYKDIFVPASIPHEVDIPVFLDIDGNKVTVSAEGATGSYTFGDALNDGDVGVSNRQSYVLYDDIRVGGMLGDMNGNRLVNMADAPLIIQALIDRSGYDAAYPEINADQIGNIDRSHSFDFGDLTSFGQLFVTPPAVVDVIAHYSFDTDFTDAGLNGLNLNASGSPAIVAANVFGGGSLDLDGTQYLWNPSNLFDFGVDDFAVAFWYQSDYNGVGSPFTNGQMVTKDNTSSLTPGWGVYQTGPIGPDPVTIAFDVDSGSFRHDEPAPADDDTVYHHLVMQRSGHNVESYLDGVLVNTLSGNVNVSTPSYAFAVGARGVFSSGAGGAFPFDGRIDELWVFDGSLTTGEITDLRDTNTPPAAPPAASSASASPVSQPASASASSASNANITVAAQGVATGKAVPFSDPSLFKSAADNRIKARAIDARAIDASFASFEDDLLLLTRPFQIRLDVETTELASGMLDSRQPSDMVESNWENTLLEMLDELLI